MAKLFNLARFKELLELEEKDKIDFLDPELLFYKASIQSQSCYNHKEDYFFLIEQYLKGDLSACEFRSKFQEIERENLQIASQIREDLRRLETLILAEDLEEFVKFRDPISDLCFYYYDIFDNDEELMSDSKFYSLVKNHYLQFQKVFPVSSGHNLLYEELIFRSFQILTGVIVLGTSLIFFNI